MGVDYSGMTTEFDNLLAIAKPLDPARIQAIHENLGKIVQWTQGMGNFVADFRSAKAGELCGKFADAADRQALNLTQSAQAISDSTVTMARQVSWFLENVAGAKSAAQSLQTVYDAHNDDPTVTSRDVKDAAAQLATTLQKLYTNSGNGSPVISLVVDPSAGLPDAAVPSVDPSTGKAISSGTQPSGGSTGQPGQTGTGSNVGPDGKPINPNLDADGKPIGPNVGPDGKLINPDLGPDGKAVDPKTSQGSDPLSSLTGMLGQLGSAAGSALGGLASTASDGTSAASNLAGLASSFASLGSQAAAPAAAVLDGEEAGDQSLENLDTVPMVASPIDGAGGGAASGVGDVAKPLNNSPNSAGFASTLRAAPGVGSFPTSPASGASSSAAGMMGMPMGGAPGMGGAGGGGGGEHRIASYLVTKQHGEQMFGQLPVASEDVLGDLDNRERLEMQVASLDETL